MVDDAIVVIENISRYIEEGESPLEAALRGSEQIGFTIISLTISLIAVLIPLLFMGDVVGRLFREFAITLAGHDPDLGSSIAHPRARWPAPSCSSRPAEAHENAFQRKTREWFDAVIDGYATLLRYVLDRQTATLLVALATLALTAWLYVVIPKGFFPVQDTGLIQGISEAPQSISFPAMAERQRALAEVILRDPDVENLSSFIGVDGTNVTLNSGRFLINLKPHGQRPSVTAIMERLTQATASVSGISLYMQPVQDLTIDDTVSRTQYQFVLEDANPAELDLWAPRLVDKLNSMPQFAQVSSDIASYGLSVYVDIDRDTAGRFGVTPATIDNALYDSFGQRIVSTIFTHTNQYRVILETDPKLQASLDSLNSIYVPTSTGTGQVPLSALVHVREETAPLRIDHLGQFPSTAISFNLGPGASLGESVDAIRQARLELGHADQRPDQPAGRGARVPEIALQRAAADPRGDRHRLHRARRALRKLRASGHYTLDAAVGGNRRAGGADGAESTETVATGLQARLPCKANALVFLRMSSSRL